MQNVLRTDGLSDVAERVHGRAADGLFVGLEHLQQLEADTHPLASADVLGTAVGDAPDKVDTVFLHLLGDGNGKRRNKNKIKYKGQDQN